MTLIGCLALVACSRGAAPQLVPPSNASGTPTPTSTPTSTPAPTVALSSISLSLTARWTNLSEPLFLTYAPGDPSRSFIVEKTGRIRVVKNGRLLSAPYLDLSGQVSTGSEQGLLGLAFSPQFMTTGRFYVNYTDRSGSTNVVGYTVADPASDAPKNPGRRRVLLVDQPYANHNGGCIVFGPDGYLYVGMGDGGSGGDPRKNGQNPDTLLAKILRIDVEADPAQRALVAYRIPPDNPFVGRTGYRPEIWAMGVRNPWRFSFDRQTGDLWVGDVGQDAWEEIDHLPARKGGQNLGWNLLEGTHPYPPGSAEPPRLSRFTMPIVEYPHPTGESITGGNVYRGADSPVLAGVYLYADFVTGKVWGLRLGETAATAQLAQTQLNIASFGEDYGGELYVCDLRGAVYQVSAKAR